MTLRVLHVLEAVQFGTVRHLAGIVRYVDAEHIVVIPPPGSGRYTDVTVTEQMWADGARSRLVPMRRSPVDPQNLAAVARVRRLVRDERPDVVHGHSSIGGAIARVAAVGTGTPTCYTPNGLFPSRAALALERALGAITTRFIASSASEAAVVRAHRLVRDDRVEVIPNGVELELPARSIDVRGSLGIDADAPLIGNVGRLATQKAPEIFVRACALVAATDPAPSFVLLGDGELADEVTREIAAAASLDGRFHLLRIPTGGGGAMAELDVFALSSRYEGAAYAPLEAMRARVPVVLTDVVGNRDAVDDGVSGLLVPPEDPAALAAAMRRLLADPALRRSIGDQGRDRVVHRFEIGAVARQLEDLYRSLIR